VVLCGRPIPDVYDFHSSRRHGRPTVDAAGNNWEHTYAMEIQVGNGNRQYYIKLKRLREAARVYKQIMRVTKAN